MDRELNIPRANFTFVIPCYNEEENLPELIDQLFLYSSENQDCLFLLVNNGSTDNSKAILDNIGSNPRLSVLNLEFNQGYGGGIWAGVSSSRTEWTGWFHADLQISLEEVIRLKNLTKATSRASKGIRTGRPIFDRLLTGGMSIFCSLLFSRILLDINGQPTIYKTEFLKAISSPPSDFSLDLHCYIEAKKAGVNLVRENVKMKERVGGSSSWNTGIPSRLRMISRTIRYALFLRARKTND